MEGIVELLTSTKGIKKEEILYKIAIVGRPNVGKSLFLNNLLQEERVIVDKVPGTTRDSIDTHFRKKDNLFLLIDTAGIRHKRKVKEAIDVYSMMRSREAIKKCDVSFLLIDGYEGLRNDDVRVLELILKSGKCCVLVVNKWDLVKNIQMADYKNAIMRRTPSFASYPIVFASAKTGRNIISCIDMVKPIMANSDQKIETNMLNKFLTQLKQSSYFGGKRKPKPYYMVQSSTRPPTFLIFVNNPKLVTSECTNFIESILRKKFFFFGTPLKVKYRRKR